MIYKKYKYLFRCFSILCFILFVVEDTNGQTAATTLQDTDSIQTSGLKIPVAYGEQDKWKNTSAISTVIGDDLRKTFAPTLSNTLYGRLPGLTVVQGSGEPGYDAPSMFARGISSYNGNRILTFVDGFESPFDQLVPDEIESISFLKDAAATALYGIRGANGVLLVTTKKGFVGKPEIIFTAQTGWQSPLRMVKPLDATNYASLYNEALQNEGKALRYTAEDIEAYRSGNDPYFRPNVNWQDEVLRRGIMQQYQLSATGGDENTKYYISGSFREEEGVQVARRQLRQHLAQPSADLRRELRCGEGEPIGLLGNGVGHPAVAMADVDAHQLRVEVDVALAVRVPEVDPLRPIDDDGIDLGLGRPREEGVVPVEPQDLFGRQPVGGDGHAYLRAAGRAAVLIRD